MTSSSAQLLSVVLPAYNEQAVLRMTYDRFTAALPSICREYGLDYELIFVNDGSRDATAGMLDDFALIDERVRAVHLARNFGHQAAITAGLNLAGGDVLAIMDCDLQDPPEVLPRFLGKWREGYQVAYAVRRKRKEWIGKRLAYWTFYRVMAAVSDLAIPLDSGDFCVMDRSAVRLLNSLPERQRFVRGLRTWVGLKQVGVEYERDARAAGVPQYTFAKLVGLAMDGLVSFSSAPLRAVTRLGLMTAVLALLLGAWIVGVTMWEWYTGTKSEAPRGWASLACLMLLMSSVQMISLGIIGEYVARVFLEVKGRPTYLIARVVGGRPDGASPRATMAAPRVADAGHARFNHPFAEPQHSS